MQMRDKAFYFLPNLEEPDKNPFTPSENYENEICFLARLRNLSQNSSTVGRMRQVLNFLLGGTCQTSPPPPPPSMSPEF
ncbi:hypothetical protein CEXT_619181 [Caerostris extrusa]|uniref:Uncharacterized protein n=1 Tax=Caerostris extrusa TaxID=172846 RepID=A0AAV4Y4M0_CAEEX|nr:hypothetical protein CEXT_619181 [Caerostris extrusa]